MIQFAYAGSEMTPILGETAESIGTDSQALGLYQLSGQLGAKRSLRELGMPETGIEKAAFQATQNPYWNPRQLELAPIRELIRRAWAGDPPAL